MTYYTAGAYIEAGQLVTIGRDGQIYPVAPRPEPDLKDHTARNMPIDIATERINAAAALEKRATLRAQIVQRVRTLVPSFNDALIDSIGDACEEDMAALEALLEELDGVK